MRSVLLPPLLKKVTLAWTLKFAVVLWNDWTGRHFSVIGKQRSQLRGIGKGGAQCRLPCDFPVKSGSQIYLINVGIHLLMCSGKLFCVPNFGDFFPWKRSFGVGKYERVWICVCVCMWLASFTVSTVFTLLLCACVCLSVFVCVHVGSGGDSGCTHTRTWLCMKYMYEFQSYIKVHDTKSMTQFRSAL